MKTQMLPLMGVALIWAFNPALGEGEKYVKIDPTTGTPEFISKDDAKKVTAMPDDEKLCEIKFKKSTTTVAVPGEGEGAQPTSKVVPCYTFDCKPSKDCEKTNKAANEEKKKIKSEIEAQEKIINPPQPKGGPKPPPLGKEEKKKAEAKVTQLKERLAKFKPECTIKYFVGPDGKDPGTKLQVPIDNLKSDKIENVVCTCQKIEVPP